MSNKQHEKEFMKVNSGISLEEENTLPKNLLCFSHLRWDFVYQRPQHLLSRLAEVSSVYFLEEPIFDEISTPFMAISKREKDLWICTPHLRHGLNAEEINQELKELINLFFINKDESEFIFWYYTPMALSFTRHLNAGLTIFDCMDELSAFKFAPQELKNLELELLEKSDIVFTGGHSLYEIKKDLHSNIHAFPSSIDKKHFSKARENNVQPEDQAMLKGPKIGFYGVIDERFDTGLIKDLADARPEWNIILIGPIVKIDPATLPKNKNIHYLGPKNYDQLPSYLSGWNVALVPFSLNESTRFVSPTKTPEYLSGGIPVVSTPIQDIINPYGNNELVTIAKYADEFIKGIEYWLHFDNKKEWLGKVDKFLLTTSWDITCADMIQIMTNQQMQNTGLKLKPNEPSEESNLTIKKIGLANTRQLPMI